MNDTTKKILILAAVFAAIFLIAKRQGKDAAKKSNHPEGAIILPSPPEGLTPYERLEWLIHHTPNIPQDSL